MAAKGKFIPTNPSKYNGDPNDITYRSSWELRMMMWFDKNKNVLSWGSETIRLDYRHPDGKNHSYYPDFIVKRKTEKGLKTTMVEVKPFKQTIPPRRPKRITRNYKREYWTYQINQAKWRSAILFCENQGWDFMLVTEKELGL